MTSILHRILYMLALVTAKRIGEVSVGSDEIHVIMDELHKWDQQPSTIRQVSDSLTYYQRSKFNTNNNKNNNHYNQLHKFSSKDDNNNGDNEKDSIRESGESSSHSGRSIDRHNGSLQSMRKLTSQTEVMLKQTRNSVKETETGKDDWSGFDADHNIQSDDGSTYDSSSEPCGGMLWNRTGIIQTPNFPNKFRTPITCVWVIDTSNLSTGPNISIIVYLTQLYVLSGLRFSEYMYYSDDYKVPSHRVFELTEDNVTQIAWIEFNSPFLEIRFTMRTLDGTHLRALDRLLDVYGFNITYEVDTVKPYHCNTMQCRFLGHCYATRNFMSYYCSCFPGFSGSDCGQGPLCEDPELNFCGNGGTCKHIGDSAITCLCPPGFKGNKCEIVEPSDIKSCSGDSASSECRKQCPITEADSLIDGKDACRCNIRNNKLPGTGADIMLPGVGASSGGSGNLGGASFVATGFSSSRSGKTRYEATIRLTNSLNAFHRSAAENIHTIHTMSGNLAGSAEKGSRNENLSNLLEKHINRILRNANITKVNDLQLINKSSNGVDITFQFFGSKLDSQRVREAINRMVERGRIGNFTLVSNFLTFQEDPPLQLKSIVLDQKSPIRENTEFILSCTAQGSGKILFHWFKDNVYINASKATRNIWTSVQTAEQKSVYTSLLGVKATRLDEGVYTCQVADWGVQQCKSIIIKIMTPPELRVDPANVTLYRGESLRVRCLSPSSNIQRYGKLGYSWTRNGALFQSDPKNVIWEDLYPDGSILKIKNIQKSAEYTCIVSNSVAPVTKSIYVTVIDRGNVELCESEQFFGVQWPRSAPGGAILSDCPKRFQGYSKRICEQRDFNKSAWQTPDFSDCIADQMVDIYNEFEALTLGYQRTNCSNILKSCLEYAMKRHTNFLPGEAGFLMEVLEKVERYLKVKGTHLEQEMASEIILHILDKVMQNVFALNNQQQVKKLQLLTQSAALRRESIAASQLATSTSSTSSLSSSVSSSSSSSSSSTASVSSISAGGAISPPSLSTSGMTSSASAKTSSISSSTGSAVVPFSSSSTIAVPALSLDRLNSFRIYTTSVKTLPFNLQIYGDDLFSDQLHMEIYSNTILVDILANSTLYSSIISYRNLTNFLPKIYFARGSDGPDIDYMPVSRIIATWLFQASRSNDNVVEALDLPIEAAHVEIIFQHESVPKNKDWTAVCGHDSKATFEATWRTDLCRTQNLMENITRCICPLSGTFVVLLAKKNYNTSIARTSSRPMFVIISCGCCFLQSCTAFAILIPVLYNRKCCITFLKMQFCTSTSTVMAIFILGFLKLLPQDWHGLISSTLASLMLLGISTLVAITLVVQSELVPRKAQMKTLSSGIRGAIGISWLLPILFAICSPLIYSIIGKWPLFWWLEIGSSGFVLFLIVEVLFIGLFILLFTTLIRKLLFLIKKHDKQNSAILRRLGLLYRTGIILFLKLITDLLFLIYLNTANEPFMSHIFGISCILLGFSILFCFVIKAEYNLRSEPINKASTKTSIEENFCSGSINSPLSFYTNHDIEKDNESGPPSSKLPLTILSTSRCSIDRMQQSKSVDTFLGVVSVSNTGLTGGGPILGSSGTGTGSKLANTDPVGICDISLHEIEPPPIIQSDKPTEKSRNYPSKSRCCNILGAGSSKPDDTWEHEINDARGFFDTYQVAQIKCTLPESHEFVGVETLDILQGVSPDSIIGIRTNSNVNPSNSINSRIKSTDISTINVKTQTPKVRKRVTIEEPKKSQISSGHGLMQSPPIITITMTGDESSPTLKSTACIKRSDNAADKEASDDDDRIDGMLDRISHDLDYLLNRTSEVPTTTTRRSNSNTTGPISIPTTEDGKLSELATVSTSTGCLPSIITTSKPNPSQDYHTDNGTIPPPPLPPLAIGHNQNLSVHPSHCRSVHEVIIEESEQE